MGTTNTKEAAGSTQPAASGGKGSSVSSSARPHVTMEAASSSTANAVGVPGSSTRRSGLGLVGSPVAPAISKHGAPESKVLETFTWRGKATTVGLTGTFNNWGPPIPMKNVGGDVYQAAVHLYPGDHEYKILIDSASADETSKQIFVGAKGKTLPGALSPPPQAGRQLSINSQSSFSVDDHFNFDDLVSESGTPPGEYGQALPTSESSKPPPTLPPQLLEVTLNSNPIGNDPTQLPEPNHVILSHLYALSVKDSVMVLGATHRFKDKYVTTVLYKPIAA